MFVVTRFISARVLSLLDLDSVKVISYTILY